MYRDTKNNTDVLQITHLKTELLPCNRTLHISRYKCDTESANKPQQSWGLPKASYQENK